jgi:hypothetical protein
MVDFRLSIDDCAALWSAAAKLPPFWRDCKAAASLPHFKLLVAQPAIDNHQSTIVHPNAACAPSPIPAW